MREISRALLSILASFLAHVAPFAAADDSPRALAAVVERARAETGLAPLLSARVRDFDLALAYAVQGALVRSWPARDTIAGFKSGFNSAAAQRRFGLAGPVFAVLPASARLCAQPSARCEVDLGDYREPVFEIEVAVRIASRVEHAPATREEMATLIDGVLGAVELAEFALAPEGEPTAADFVASNVGVRHLIVGAPYPVEYLAQPLPMALRGGDGTIVAGDGAGALDSAFALVRQVVEYGYVLKPGQVLLTGAVGGPQPGRKGDFVADFGRLGTIRFSAR